MQGRTKQLSEQGSTTARESSSTAIQRLLTQSSESELLSD
jgi:hypothetical protein